MERLTARDPAGNAYLPYCEECGGDMCRYRCEHFDKVCEKLAGYEEQGDRTEKLLEESEAARAELGKRLAAAQKMNTELTDAQAVMVKEFTAKLEELERVKAERSWISVKDRLPEDKRRVLVRCKTVGTTAGWRLWGEWMTDLGDGGSEVAYWMPLPEPPEEEM